MSDNTNATPTTTEESIRNVSKKFDDDDDNGDILEIYLDCGEKYDFHMLTAQESGIISTRWENIKTNVVYKLESVSEERKCYNHLTDNIDTVQIMTINDNTTIEKLIAPYAFLETFFIISLPLDSKVYFKKIDPLNIKWMYYA